MTFRPATFRPRPEDRDIQDFRPVALFGLLLAFFFFFNMVLYTGPEMVQSPERRKHFCLF
jgi:hypothetical protein